MEIIIGLAILGVGLWWFFVRDEKKPVEVAPAAPYKVPEPDEPGKSADDRVETPAPVVEKSKVTKSNGLKNLAESNPDVEQALTDISSIFGAFNQD